MGCVHFQWPESGMVSDVEVEELWGMGLRLGGKEDAGGFG